MRGVGPNPLWVDEAGFTKQDLFLNVLLPITEVRNTALILISTLVDMWNYLTVLMNLKDPETNENIFNVFQQTLVCDRCMQTERPQDCRHKLHEIPPYKSAAKLDVVKHIYGSDVQLLQRESMGIIGETGGEIFTRRWIKRLMEKEHYDWEKSTGRPPTFVYVGCDPNAQSVQRNETAVVAVVIHGGSYIVSSFLFIYFITHYAQKTHRQFEWNAFFCYVESHSDSNNFHASCTSERIRHNRQNFS